MRQIPKIIHYCWLSGDPLPEFNRYCLNTWKEQLPDYEIMLWDTNKIDINRNDWLRDSFRQKKYAFASDYIRFYALYNHGGIYLDSDVEVHKSFNDLLGLDSFFGLETTGDIEAAVIGAKSNIDWIKSVLDYYEKRDFLKSDGNLNTKPLPQVLKKRLKEIGMEVKISDDIQKLEKDVVCFPAEYFSPKNIQTKKIKSTKNTYCVHHFGSSWVEQTSTGRLKKLAHLFIINLFGEKVHRKIVSIFR